MKTIALFSVKGGVGKTALAVNLAHASATQSARRTLLWDLDGQGAAGFALRLAPVGSARRLFTADAELGGSIQPSAYARLDVIAADKSLRHLERVLAEGDARSLRRILKALAPAYDRVVLDCPPGLSALADEVFRAADLLVVPLVPSPLSLRGFDQLVAHLAKHHRKGPRVVPVWSMVDSRRALHRATVATAPDRRVVPYSAVIDAMTVHQAPVGVTHRASAAARVFNGLWADVEAALA